ncbi:MAG TPA: ABC transporter permease [Candidatus Angelobacter sp.]|nr:ABC transporter permease [Candidatus Angelobacter sp.]
MMATILWLIIQTGFLPAIRFLEKWPIEAVFIGARGRAHSLGGKSPGTPLLVQYDATRTVINPGPFLMNSIYQDFRFTLRGLRNDRRFALLSVFALAVGIGATTLIFSLVYNILLDPFPYKGSPRLVKFEIENLNHFQGITHRADYWPMEFRAIREQSHVFDDMVGYQTDSSLHYDGGKGAGQVRAAWVTGNTFKFYGVAPVLGRWITEEDERPNAPPVFAIDYELWQSEFSGDPKALGATFVIGEEARTLVAVMPRRFNVYGANIWLPRDPDKSGSLVPVGRLKPGVSVQAARAELDLIIQRLLPSEQHVRVTVRSLIDDSVGGFKKILYALLGAVVMLLFIGCINVANLLLARTTAREREIVIRASLGASRWRLMQQLLVESFVLSLAGCGAGCLAAYFGLKLVVRIIPPGTIPSEAMITLNPAILIFAIGIAMVTTLACGLAPALHAASGNLWLGVTGSGKVTSRSFRHGKFRAALVIFEVALSIVLLVGGGLMMRSFFALTHVDLPFKPENVLYIQLSFPRNPYYTNYLQHKPDKKPEFFNQLLPRIDQLPGVVSSTETWKLPPYDFQTGSDVTIPGRPHVEPWPVHVEFCTEGYFNTLGVGLTKGELLSHSDVELGRHVAVVNEDLVRRYLGDQNPIGVKIKFNTFDRTFLDAPHDTYFEIIGVVRDFPRRPDGAGYAVMPVAFLPGSVAGFANPLSLLAKSRVDPHTLLKSVYREIWTVDPRVTFSASGSIKDFLDDQNTIPRFEFITLASFAGVALLLVAIGTFSVTAYMVSLQTHDIGIRMALGARRSTILGMVIGKGVSLIAAGVAIGCLMSVALTRYLSSAMWGISSTDPWTFCAVIALVIVVGLGACVIPARRATQVDPMIALRQD